MRDFGGITLSFETGSLDNARRVLEGVRLLARREPRGCRIAHLASRDDDARLRATQITREALGITDGLVRISAGLEDPGRSKEDLSRALDAISSLHAVARRLG